MPDLARTAEDLKREEGYRKAAYQDHLGFWTIGYGRMIDERKSGGISLREAGHLLNNDIMGCLADLDRNISWWRGLPEGPQQALVQMCFQMGWPSLRGFRRMLESLMNKDYETAKRHALDSKWARRDTPARAKRVAAMLRSDETVEV